MNIRPITEDELQAFVDQRLDEDRYTAVRAYLEAHPDVADRIARYGEQREQLAQAFAPAAHEPVPPELNIAHLVQQHRRRSTGGWRHAAAAAVLLAIGCASGWFARDADLSGQRSVLAIAAEAAASYHAFAPDFLRPVELRASDQQVLVDWAARRLGRVVSAPDLSSAGYRFMGGRLVPTGHGPALIYMYDDDHGTRLVMMARPLPNPQDGRPMRPYTQDGVRGYAWGDDGFGYSLVGPDRARNIHPLANELRRQLRPHA